MKHFFFSHDESFNLVDLLMEYLSHEPAPMSVKALKVYYDMTDIISDKRFEHGDDTLKDIIDIGGEQNNLDNEEFDANEDEHLRLRALMTVWNRVEQQYKRFHADNKEVLYDKPIDSEDADRQYNISLMLVLYHLVRGNLCLRISQYHYENFNLGDSDNWADKGIEIFWHGKNLVAALRDSAKSDKRVQADLYLRLIKLNLAKYYRDYARKNRRSDFDAALDEFMQVRYRVEEEYGHISDPKQKRQYVLIWMDAIINIAKIHRRKYQIDTSEKEMLFLYSCLKNRLQAEEQSLIEKADQVISDRERCLQLEGEWLLENDASLVGLNRKSFDKCDDLDAYDRRRYFLLVLLELARIQRDLHCVENYERSIAIAIIADQWSDELDGYTLGHNMDAFITISSSLRKYIKFQETATKDELPLEQIVIQIDGNEYQMELKDTEGQKRCASLVTLMDQLTEFAKKGNLKSKAEVIKWCCLYQQAPELLAIIKDKVEDKDITFEVESSNCHLQFMNGLLALRTEKYGEAIKIFTGLLEKNQKEMQYIRLGSLGLKTRYLLANCYMSRAEFAKAEKILSELKKTLATAKESRKSQGVQGSTDAETDARIEIDLGYCYMQRGDYEEAFKIYKELFGVGNPSGGKLDFGLHQVKRQRRIMGLNNYASSCIFSIDDEENGETSKMRGKIEIARKIFQYMDTHFPGQGNEKEADRYEWNPETNLLKGYYTLCTGIEPGVKPISDKQFESCQDVSVPGTFVQRQALLRAFPYFRKACRFEEAFPSRYSLLDEHDMGNKARYRNEVERISVYVISLTKLQSLYLLKQEQIEKLNTALEESEGKDIKNKLFGEDFTLTKQQLEYLTMSRQNLERFLLHFPANYAISLKAAFALADWLLKMYEEIQKMRGDK